jgi:hypothetical protein
MSTSRNEIPDYAERARRLADLSAAPALPICDIALILDLPLSTIDKLRAEGRGPKCFRIGRRLYVRQSDFREWPDTMARGSRVAGASRAMSRSTSSFRDYEREEWTQNQAEQKRRQNVLRARRNVESRRTRSTASAATRSTCSLKPSAG